MKIVEIDDRNAALIEKLVELWEGSVRATHTFLAEEDIVNLRSFVPAALWEVPRLYVAMEDNTAVGFMGTSGTILEMLFVAADRRHQGIGSQLLRYGIEAHSLDEVAVNEQNPQARAFYEHMGFLAYKRSELDEQGNPFPLLYMKRQGEERHENALSEPK